MAQLDRIEGLQKSVEINYDGKLDDIRKDLVQLMSQKSKDDEQRAALRVLQSAKLSVLQEEHSACLRQTRVIPSLYVPVLNKRWREIPNADESSNSWLFGPDLRSYVSWLENDNGVYLIKGKVCLIRYLYSIASNPQRSLAAGSQP